jgi:N-acetyltransferase
VSRFTPIADARPVDQPWPPFAWPLEPGARLQGRIVELTLYDPVRDGDALYAAVDHDECWEHIAGRPADAAAYGDTLASASAQNRFPWVVRLAREHAGLPSGSVVGTSSYLDVSPVDARLEIGSTAYDPRVWATAVNPEAKLLLLAHAFDELGAGRVQLKTDVRNQRSQGAIARLGARYEATLRRYQRRSDDTVRDTVLFSILSEEWPAVREGLERRLAQWR